MWYGRADGSPIATPRGSQQNPGCRWDAMRGAQPTHRSCPEPTSTWLSLPQCCSVDIWEPDGNFHLPGNTLKCFFLKVRNNFEYLLFNTIYPKYYKFIILSMKKTLMRFLAFFFPTKSLKSGVYFILTRHLALVAKFPLEKCSPHLDFIKCTIKHVDSHIKAVPITQIFSDNWTEYHFLNLH